MIHKIDIDEVLIYSYCPMLYKYIYIDKVSNNNISIQKEYNETFRKTIYGFLASLIDSSPSFSHMKSIWGRLWIKEKKTIEYIYSNSKSWRNNHNEKRKIGISSLKNFYDYVYANPFFPIIFNKSYSVKIHNIELSGRFDIIVESKNNINIIVIKAGSKKFNTIHINKDLEITAMSYAFRELFKIEETNIIIFNSEKGNYVHTHRTKKQYDILENTVLNVYKCIKNNIFYMCPDNKCYTCSYKTICSAN